MQLQVLTLALLQALMMLFVHLYVLVVRLRLQSLLRLQLHCDLGFDCLLGSLPNLIADIFTCVNLLFRLLRGTASATCWLRHTSLRSVDEIDDWCDLLAWSTSHLDCTDCLNQADEDGI